MFTGIVEEIGSIVQIQQGARSSRLKIQGSLIFDDMTVGDSIAVNGVCLTVNRFQNKTFEADVMSETLNRSTLGNLKEGSPVNLERAMQLNGRFGGHIVSGHIDGTGALSAIKQDDNATWITVRAGKEILEQIVEKGSICIDGISLTIAHVDSICFQVSVIPHTAKSTILGEKRIGDHVNLENDVIGKYIKKFVTVQEPNRNITEEFLMKAGF